MISSLSQIVAAMWSHLKRKTVLPCQEDSMNKDRRWLKSAIAAAAGPQIAMPWAHSARRRPDVMKVVTVPKPRAIAAS